MWERQHDNADWDCFRTLILLGDLEDSKSTSGGLLCIFGSHTFVPTSWMCKKQTSISLGSTEAEIISLDAGLRIGGIPALDLLGFGYSSVSFFTKPVKETKDQVLRRLVV